MIQLYENDLFEFKYKLPYLYITIKKGKITKDEWIMSQLVLKKFYEKNIKERFYLVFEYRYLEICNMKKINPSFLLYLVSKHGNQNMYTKSNSILLRDTLPKRKRLQLEFLLRKK